MIEWVEGALGYLRQRGCMVFCMSFWIWFWGALVVGFLFGWMARTRLGRDLRDEDDRDSSPRGRPEP